MFFTTVEKNVRMINQSVFIYVELLFLPPTFYFYEPLTHTIEHPKTMRKLSAEIKKKILLTSRAPLKHRAR